MNYPTDQNAFTGWLSGADRPALQAMLRFFLDPVWFFYIFWLPNYLVDDKGLSVTAAGLLTWIPFLAADVGTLAGGSLASWLQHRGWSVNRAHKVVMAVSAVMMMCSVAVPLLAATWQYVAAMCVSISATSKSPPRKSRLAATTDL